MQLSIYFSNKPRDLTEHPTLLVDVFSPSVTHEKSNLILSNNAYSQHQVGILLNENFVHSCTHGVARFVDNASIMGIVRVKALEGGWRCRQDGQVAPRNAGTFQHVTHALHGGGLRRQGS